MTKVRMNEPVLEALVSSPHGPLLGHMIELAERVADQARTHAPYDASDTEHTHVRDAIEVQITRGQVRVASTAADSRGRPVGLFVEVGTRHMAAQPYLRPAFDAVIHHA